MHKALHPRDYVDRYVLRKEVGRGLTSIENSVDALIQRLEDFIEKCGERMITAIRNNTDNTKTNRTKITRKQKWDEKQLYIHTVVFKWQTCDISHEKTWMELKKGNSKRESESLLIAAQNNAIRINYIQARRDKTQQNSKCRWCGDRDETINHIISWFKKSIRLHTTGWGR